ncbi:hypothetical protein B484DRAFT_333345, partial [Ochromonadaceae sp. CCMP2298]
MCDITERILSDYDRTVLHCLQLAYDIFDSADKDQIAAADLERVMRSIGYVLTYEEVDQLLTEIDPRQTGFLEFNEFMAQVVGFLRIKYGKVATLSILHLQDVFAKFDQSGDGLLQPYELKHVIRMIAKTVTQDEVDALVDYLDVDGDGDISWEEFMRM